MQAKGTSHRPLLASPTNMEKCRTYGGLFAYDRYSRERFSATAGDYFMHDPDKPLTGKFGKPLILAREVRQIVAVSA